MPSPYLGDARPWLAKAIVPEGTDGRRWRIQLRDGVRWHDGQPFTANDVVFTLRYYRDGTPNRWTHHVSDNPKLTTIEPIDRLSLRVGCEVPCPLFDRVTRLERELKQLSKKRSEQRRRVRLVGHVFCLLGRRPPGVRAA